MRHHHHTQPINYEPHLVFFLCIISHQASRFSCLPSHDPSSPFAEPPLQQQRPAGWKPAQPRCAVASSWNSQELLCSLSVHLGILSLIRSQKGRPAHHQGSRPGAVWAHPWSLPTLPVHARVQVPARVPLTMLPHVGMHMGESSCPSTASKPYTLALQRARPTWGSHTRNQPCLPEVFVHVVRVHAARPDVRARPHARPHARPQPVRSLAWGFPPSLPPSLSPLRTWQPAWQTCRCFKIHSRRPSTRPILAPYLTFALPLPVVSQTVLLALLLLLLCLILPLAFRAL